MIYLDNHATTVPDPRVVEAMVPWFSRAANAGSPHAAGREAEHAIYKAREHVAALLGCPWRSVVFTSGATESNNIAILGAPARGGRRITCSTEHPSVLRPLEAGWEARWWDLTVLDPGPGGSVEPAALEAELELGDVELVAFMLANNETGAVSPVPELAELCGRYGVPLHCDAAQGFGKIPFDPTVCNTVSVSGHKIHGPQGVGALYMRRTAPKLKTRPVAWGGEQERGVRPGTVPVALVVGFGEACRIAADEFEDWPGRCALLRDRLLDGIRAGIAGVRVNGPLENRLPNNLNLVLPGVPSSELVHALDGIVAVSSGSACSSRISRVLIASGVSPEDAACSIRFGLGRFTTEADIDRAVEVLTRTVARL